MFSLDGRKTPLHLLEFFHWPAILYIYRLSFDFQSAPEICFQGCFCHSVHFPSLQMLMNKHRGHVKHAHASEAVRGHFPSAPASSHTSQLICLSPVIKNSCGSNLGSRFTGGIYFGSTWGGTFSRLR